MAKFTVQGQGEATAEPDVADVHFSVESTGSRPSESIAKSSELMKKLLEVTQKYGIEKKHTKTTGFNNQAVYEQPKKVKKGEEETPPKITHYQAYNQVTVRLHQFDKLGEFLTELASTGAMSLSTSFDIGDKTKLQSDARENAFNNAKAKAEQYANLSGLDGTPKVTELNESARWGGGHGGGYAMAAAAVTKSVMLESVPMEGGEQTVSVTVNAVFEV